MIVARGRAPVSEEIARTERAEERGAFSVERIALRGEGGCRALPLFSLQGEGDGLLSRAAGARVALAQRGQRAGAGRSETEVAASERVAHTDVVIQVGQRRHAGDLGFRACDDHRQPEAQLAQPDGDRIAIHAEDAVCEDLSSDVMRVGRGGRARGALGALVQDAEAFERVHQKGSGSAGRVENAQAVQGIVGRGREQERRGRVVERIGGEIWKCRVQGIADDLIDEGGWGVEGARPSALVGGHE